MKSLKKSHSGFTLIELLVVVLIIGILAAVALPQYEKAVWKARLTQVSIWQNSAMHALEVFMLAKGSPKDSIDILPEDLDVDVGAGFTCSGNMCHDKYFKYYMYAEPVPYEPYVGAAVYYCESGICASGAMPDVEIRYEKLQARTYTKECFQYAETKVPMCQLMKSLDSEYTISY